MKRTVPQYMKWPCRCTADAWASGFCISDWAEDALQLSDNVRLKSATLAVPETLRPGLTTSERQQALGAAPEIADVLRNGVTMPAHGPAETPTWGADFREMDGLDVTQVKLRIANLTSGRLRRQSWLPAAAAPIDQEDRFEASHRRTRRAQPQ
jgi:hypothetical protein